jgi:hypothetical protein
MITLKTSSNAVLRQLKNEHDWFSVRLPQGSRAFYLDCDLILRECPTRDWRLILLREYTARRTMSLQLDAILHRTVQFTKHLAPLKGQLMSNQENSKNQPNQQNNQQNQGAQNQDSREQNPNANRQDQKNDVKTDLNNKSGKTDNPSAANQQSDTSQEKLQERNNQSGNDKK